MIVKGGRVYYGVENRVFEWKTRKKLLNDEIAEFIKKGFTVDNIYIGLK